MINTGFFTRLQACCRAPFRAIAVSALGFFALGCGPTYGDGTPWQVLEADNPEGPGSVVEVREGQHLVARLVHGEGQMKPFLHVFGRGGERLTNPGLDEAGETQGEFPHHRGIFIGWNHIDSELGRDDLWHLRQGEWMEVVEIKRKQGGDSGALIEAEIVWRSSEKDDQGSNELLREIRTISLSRPEGGVGTQVDVRFQLTAVRDVKLGGDLQHAGIHFRADHTVGARRGETIYLWEPPVDDGGGRIVNADMKWCRFLFPIGDNWYSALQLNPDTNPTEELSWRDYGRFGFFFKHELAAGESFHVDYRFLIEPAEAPAGEGGTLTEEQEREARQRAEAAHRAFAPGS